MKTTYKRWFCNAYTQNAYETEVGDPRYGFKTRKEAIEDAIDDLKNEIFMLENTIIKRNLEHIKKLEAI